MRLGNEQISRTHLIGLTATAKTSHGLAEKMLLIKRLAQITRLQSDDLFEFKKLDPKIGTIRGNSR